MRNKVNATPPPPAASVLVTGGSGFIGRAVLAALRARGLDPVAPSSSELDLLDDRRVAEFLRELRPTHLVHAAWRSVHGDVMSSPQNDVWAAASLALTRAFYAAGGERAALLGSSAEYDWSGGTLKVGETPLRPATPYGAAKNALRVGAERLAREAGKGLVWPRVFFVYGPHEHPSRLSMAVLRAALGGVPINLTEGRQLRDYVYVRDVGEGVAAALLSAHEGETDLASGAPVSVRDLASAIAREAGREDVLRFGARPSPAHDAPLVVGDPEHARTHIGWSATTTLAQGVKEFVAWGRENVSL